MRNKKYCIYVLINPINGVVFYVGKTNNPKARLSGHCSGSDNKKKAEFIKSIGVKPKMKVIKWFRSETRALMAESLMIKRYRKIGVELYNRHEFDLKKPVNVSLYKSVIETGEAKATKKNITFSAMIELAINNYNAE
jgi:predicted GIY-YIG superfamily endonuclease